MTNVLLHDLNRRLRDLFEQEHNYAAGFALGRHILRYYPRHLATYIQLGVASLAVGLYSDAADLLRRALSSNPEAGTLWAGLRQATTALGLTEEAAIARQYERDLLTPATGRDARPIDRAILASSNKNWPQALLHYRQAYQRAPGRMDIALGMATSLYHQDRYNDCNTATAVILDQLPYCLKANILFIRCARRDREHTIDTSIYLKIARSLDPDDAYAWYWFGQGSEPAPPPIATLPDWDTSDRWPFNLAATPLPPNPAGAST
ncbi:MAG: hypothetical protein GY759_20190 [Chloroflexi bacterium]|nr:hypothetical protein [Chloroflexota bacterium]